MAGVALQAFALGIPCIYYGTEQSLAGPEAAERFWLPEWKSSDRYLREAMFGPAHPRRSGRGSLQSAPDLALPGFGPFGTAGQHCFDENSPAFTRIAAINAARAQYPCLRHGRQYPRPISVFGRDFDVPGPGELIAWSRLLDDEELLCVVNGHGTDPRGADILVDASLNPPGSAMTVVLNTAQAARKAPYSAPHAVGSRLVVKRSAAGIAFVEIRQLPPSEVLLLANHPQADGGGLVP